MDLKANILNITGLSMGALKIFIDTGMDIAIGLLTIACFVYSIQYHRIKIKKEKKEIDKLNNK